LTLRKIAVTGYPGWLSCALIDDFANDSGANLSEVVFLTRPSEVQAAAALSSPYPWKSAIVPFDLEARESLRGRLEGVDAIVHAAALIHVRRTSDWYRVNTEGTARLAGEAKRAGVRRFVFISSIAAAGRSGPHRHLSEEDEPRPLHHYGRSKLLAERQLLAMHEPGVFDVVILRPAMFYGPPVPQRHADIYRRILHGMMPLVGDGKYNRSLVHIGNLVQAVRLALTSSNAPGNSYFIVDGPVYTTLAIVEAMAEALGTKPRYLHLPQALAQAAYQIDRMVSAVGFYAAPIHLVGEAHWHQAASCQKAMRELGYAPKVELREGMRGAIDWCRQNGMI
jgi:UDP-glucose 4-epimerase